MGIKMNEQDLVGEVLRGLDSSKITRIMNEGLMRWHQINLRRALDYKYDQENRQL